MKQKQTIRKRLLYSAIAVILLLVGIMGFGADYMLRYACEPSIEHTHNLDTAYAQVYGAYPELKPWHDSLVAAGLWRDTTIVAHDGTHRHIIILEHRSNADGASIGRGSQSLSHQKAAQTAAHGASIDGKPQSQEQQTGSQAAAHGASIDGKSQSQEQQTGSQAVPAGATLVVHGYGDNAVRMMRYVYLHYEVLGRNVVVPDLYGHGLSDGDHIRFGWLDSEDCAEDYLPLTHRLWPQLNIVQHGLSMGGATTMMTAGREIADSLRVVSFIEDCGYSSTWDQLQYQLREEFSLPAFPMLYVANALCQWRYGWDMRESSAVAQLAKSKLPVFFIHGAKDTYVPTAMVRRNYDAKTVGRKQLWIVPQAEHAQSIHLHWDEYCQRVKAWLIATE